MAAQRLRPRRSVLYVPGASPRAIEKAATLACDAIIFDLEDSVGAEAKADARVSITTAIHSGRYAQRELIIRINGLDSGLAEADCAAVADARPDAVLAPKVDGATDIARVHSLLSKAGAREMPVWAMIETPAAVINASEIADAPGVACLVAGTNDLADGLRVRMRAGRGALVPHLAVIVAAARAHGRCLLDGTFNDIRDRDGFRAECEQGRDLGFDGKTVIHPDQIADANGVFAPTADDIAWARDVVDAFARPENTGKAVLAVNGKMAERLHERGARETLAIAEAIENLSARSR